MASIYQSTLTKPSNSDRTELASAFPQYFANKRVHLLITKMQGYKLVFLWIFCSFVLSTSKAGRFCNTEVLALEDRMGLPLNKWPSKNKVNWLVAFIIFVPTFTCWICIFSFSMLFLLSVDISFSTYIMNYVIFLSFLCPGTDYITNSLQFWKLLTMKITWFRVIVKGNFW